MAFIFNPSGGGSGATATVEIGGMNYNFVDGSLASVTDPPTDYSLECNGGGGYTTVPNDPAFCPTGALTVECWVNSTDTSPAYPALVCMDQGSGQLSWTIYGGSGNWVCVVNTDSGEYYVTFSWSPTFDGGWHHIALVWDGSTIYAYLDGVLQASTSAPGSYITNTYTLPVQFGQSAQNLGDGYNGLLAEVRISNVARYPGGTTFTPETSFDPEASGTVAYWPLNDGSGNTAVDSSGNGHDASLSESPAPTWAAEEP